MYINHLGQVINALPNLKSWLLFSRFLAKKLYNIPVSGQAEKYNHFLKDQKILKTSWLCDWDTNKTFFLMFEWVPFHPAP